jgi:hypothetical protein
MGASGGKQVTGPLERPFLAVFGLIVDALSTTLTAVAP